MDWKVATVGCITGWLVVLFAPIISNATQVERLSQDSERNSAEEVSPSGLRAFQLHLSTDAIQLLDTNESDVWLDLFAGGRGGFSGWQRTLVATTQHLMPLYLRSVQGLEQRNLRLSVNNGSRHQVAESWLESFAGSHRCQVTWNFPEQLVFPGLSTQHQLEINRTRLPGSDLCQPVRGIDKLQLSTRLSVSPTSIGDMGTLDLGSLDYRLKRNADGDVTNSLKIAPKFTLTPFESVRLDLRYNLKLESSQFLPEDWLGAIRTHRAIARLSLRTPQMWGSKVEWQFKGEYDWLKEVVKPIDIEFSWHLLPFKIHWQASTEYSTSTKAFRPIQLNLHHELPWGIGWGVSTHYQMSNGKIGPLRFSLDSDISIFNWLFSPNVLGNRVGIHYGLEALQSEDDGSVDYAIGAGIVAGNRESGLWDFNLDIGSNSLQYFRANYHRRDWQFQVRFVPSFDDRKMEGRIIFMPENRLSRKLPSLNSM